MAEKAIESCKIEEVKSVYKGKWLDTRLIKYVDPVGVKRDWEACGFIKQNRDVKLPDSVQVIAILQRNLHHNCFVLVEQFRPPIGCYSIEFPAGFVSEEDSSVQAAALRELHEETGYTGTIAAGDHLDVPVSLEPGCLTSNITNVHVLIDGDNPQNINCKQHLDEGEFVKVLIFPVRNILHHLNQYISDKNEKYVIDSKLYCFALGLHMGATLDKLDKPIFDPV